MTCIISNQWLVLVIAGIYTNIAITSIIYLFIYCHSHAGKVIQNATEAGASTLPDELNMSSALFDLLDKDSAVNPPQPPEDRPPSVSTAGVRKVLLRVNINKAAGPDNKVYYTENMCRSASRCYHRHFFTPSPQEIIPPLPRHSIIFPVPKKSAVSSLNDSPPS